MNPLRIYILLLLGMCFAACQSATNTESTKQAQPASSPGSRKAVSDLEGQILAVHDSVMPAMSDVMKLRKQVIQRLTDLDKQAASADVNQQKTQGQAVRDALMQADESMMNWMHQYNGDTLAKLDEPQAVTYLKDQLQRINTMTEQMRKSITDARDYLNKP